MTRSAMVSALAGVVCILLAGCVPEGGVSSTGERSTSSVEATATTTSIAVPTTVITAIATSTTVTPPETLRTPDEFPTIEQLAILASPFRGPIDAQINSSVAWLGDEDELEDLGFLLDTSQSMTITYFGGLTVWDYPDGSREVRFGDQLVYLSDDGVWLESDRFEWPVLGPLGEWGFAQSLAVDVLGADPEVVGFEEVVGVPTVHLRLVFEEGFENLWIDASGLVLKLITEFDAGSTSLRFQTVWEVIDLDVEPGEPLPPGA